jgi:hypothetical protein
MAFLRGGGYANLEERDEENNGEDDGGDANRLDETDANATSDEIDEDGGAVVTVPPVLVGTDREPLVELPIGGKSAVGAQPNGTEEEVDLD